GLKGYELLRYQLPPNAGSWHGLADLSIVGAEVIWAAWLVLGHGGAKTWFLTMSMWVAFAGFNVYGVAVGKASCGCFGPVRVSPGVTLVLDVLGLGLTALSRPPRRESGDLVGSRGAMAGAI